jgi:hypothetical protein
LTKDTDRTVFCRYADEPFQIRRLALRAAGFATKTTNE